MNLYEYQAKELFLKYELPVLQHWVCSDLSKIDDCISSITHSPPWMVKCQIHAGSRGKSGGVLSIHSKKEIFNFAKKWIGSPLITNQTAGSGEIVNSILIEPSVKIIKELYLSLLIHRSSFQIVLITTTKGGINIEDTISKYPDSLYKITIDPMLSNIHPYEGRVIARKLGLYGVQIHQFVKIYMNIIRMFIDKDLILVEINPLVITENNHLICLDAKITVDHNSLFRQPELLDLYLQNNKNQNLYISDPSKTNYISLDGNIGCMVNGAGLAMATMDLMKLLGGSPANFLDIGGDADKNYIISALKMLIQNRKVQAIFINIFGGIVCCDLVANSIITAISECVTNTPVVVRLEGNNSEIGLNKLMHSNLNNVIATRNLAHAIQKVITLVK